MNLTFKDFAAFWNGRPKVRPLSLSYCPIYVFYIVSAKYISGNFVDVHPSRYIPKDWRGLL